MLTLNVIRNTQPKELNGDDFPKEYNGLPIVRAPKELGRRGLTNNNIIIHPSGLKLSKVPNGYIILCSHDGCGCIGSKDGIKCVKHAESYKYCRYPECNKRAHYGHERKKPLNCATHRSNDMIDVVHNVCLADGCNLLAYFGVKDGPAQYCSKHKSPEMIDVLHKKCIAPGCMLIPSFGIEGGPVQYCSEHRPNNTVDVKHKKCLFPGCNVIPSFGFEGGKVEYCFNHMLEGMIDLKNKKCLFPNCNIRPTFGVIGASVQYCSIHKLPEMIDLRNKKCLFPECVTYPCFGFLGGQMQYCNQHKQQGMVNIRNKKCIFEDCLVQARFGLPAGVAEYCSEHKLDGMINVRDKMCDIDNCNRRPSYSLLFSTVKIHCKEHATLNEYMYEKRNPICSELKCRNPACFVESDDITIYPVRCSDHKIPNDIELVRRQCPNCEDIIHFPTNQECCMECGKYREILICSDRETAIENLLRSNNINFIHDKCVIPGGSRNRPDFLIASNFGFIIIEVDENQHNKYFEFEEYNRMKVIYQDVQLIYSGGQVLFIRYNPDKYIGDVVIDQKQRLEYLLLIVSNMMTLSTLGIPLGYIKLFYDGFTGAPSIQSLDIKDNCNNI